MGVTFVVQRLDATPTEVCGQRDRAVDLNTLLPLCVIRWKTIHVDTLQQNRIILIQEVPRR